MFIHALSDLQKKAFFDLANQMILADDIVADEEVSYLNRLYWEAGLIERRGPSDDGEEAALHAFNGDRGAQLICVAELLTIAIIDGHYRHAEDAYAIALIGRFDIPPEDHDAVNRIAEHIAGAITGMKNLTG